MQNELPSDILNESLHSLELPAVLEEVSAHAATLPGKEKVLSSRPGADLELIRTQLRLVGEIEGLAGLDGSLAFGGIVPMETVFFRLDRPSTILEPEEIFVVADLVSASAAILERIEKLDQRFVLLHGEAARISSLPSLGNRIHGVLDEHGEVRPTASRALMEIRGRMRSVRGRIRKRLEGIVQDRDLSRVVQEDYVTMRNDRYVILLRPEFKGLLDGIVHDHSRSGESVYVEPLHVVELNNEVASLADEERDEIRRIFKELTDEIRSVKDTLLSNNDVLSDLDAFQARALYARATSSIVPELSENGFHIRGARHPLLLAAQEGTVVPMDVIQDPVTSATVVSGANMGGKTVALKIAGLFPLMIRCGLMVPALEGTRLQPFFRIMADIGEEQDIRGRVSSFSGRMLKIKSILDAAGPGDLVLLDELGSATDPEEGSALAMAVIDELIQRRVRTVVTTHLTHLKAYALSRPDVKNVSVEFHPHTLKPTYRLLYDLPGESHAIETAQRIGVAEGVIEAARRYFDRGAGGGSRLIENLRQKMAEVEQLRLELHEQRSMLAAELEHVQSRREELVEEFRSEARDMMRRAEKEIADIRKSAKAGLLEKGKAAKEALARIKSDMVDTLGAPLEKPAPHIETGFRVHVKSLGKDGVVTAALDRGKVEVSMGRMTVRTDPEDLVIVDRSRDKKSSSKKYQVGVEIPLATPQWEVNVIGRRVDEALPIVEKALDHALMAGLSSISVIHGKGTGRLKKAVREYLSDHALVRAVRGGDIERGGEGVTIADIVTE